MVEWFFFLDMGQPVRITDLAKEMIKLSGLTVRDEANPDGDIVIEEVGLRPGEKLFEELLISAESVPTAHPRVVCGREERLHWSALHPALSRLRSEVDRVSVHSAVQIVRELVPGYCSPRSPSANARELETSAA